MEIKIEKKNLNRISENDLQEKYVGYIITVSDNNVSTQFPPMTITEIGKLADELDDILEQDYLDKYGPDIEKL